MSNSFQETYSNYIDAMNAKQRSMDAFAKFNFRWLRKIQIELQLDMIQCQNTIHEEETCTSKENIDESNTQLNKKKKKKMKDRTSKKSNHTKIAPHNIPKVSSLPKSENANGKINQGKESENINEKKFLDTGSLLTNILPDALELKGSQPAEANSEYVKQFANSKEFNKRWKENLKPQNCTSLPN